MIKVIAVSFLLMLILGCSKGPHVTTETVTISKYVCRYSDSVWNTDRNVAYCDSLEECNQICAKLPR